MHREAGFCMGRLYFDLLMLLVIAFGVRLQILGNGRGAAQWEVLTFMTIPLLMPLGWVRWVNFGLGAWRLCAAGTGGPVLQQPGMPRSIRLSALK